MEGNVFKSMKFLRAATPEKLQKKMLENNINSNMEYRYQSIQYVDHFWYAWYIHNFESEVKEKLTKAVKGRSNEES